MDPVQPKPMPTVEQSLKSLAWHAKVIGEELLKIRTIMEGNSEGSGCKKDAYTPF